MGQGFCLLCLDIYLKEYEFGFIRCYQMCLQVYFMKCMKEGLFKLHFLFD